MSAEEHFQHAWSQLKKTLDRVILVGMWPEFVWDQLSKASQSMKKTECITQQPLEFRQVPDGFCDNSNESSGGGKRHLFSSTLL